MLSVEWLDGPSEGDLLSMADLLSGYWQEILPDEPDIPATQLAAEIAGTPGHRRWMMATAAEDGELVGAVHLVLDDLRGRSRDGWVKYLVVRPDHRRRGVGSALLEAVSARASAEHRRRLQSFVASSHPGGTAFAAANGATPGIADRQSRLRVDDLDIALLDEWVSRVAERARDYDLVCFDGVCPDEWLSRFAELTSVMNTAPRAEGAEDVFMTEQQVRAGQEAHLRGGGWGWTVCARHVPSGRFVGYTELGGSCHRPWLAAQGDTGVEPAHRALGIGRWVKATNALRLLKEKPDVRVVETWNAGVNAPMLAINDAMGFRPVCEWQEWRLGIQPG